VSIKCRFTPGCSRRVVEGGIERATRIVEENRAYHLAREAMTGIVESEEKEEG
jgi:hypothetical protein